MTKAEQLTILRAAQIIQEYINNNITTLDVNVINALEASKLALIVILKLSERAFPHSNTDMSS